MLLTLTATASPAMPDASDLGFLLHKHPERVQRFDLPVGAVTVFYPEASPERCTAALLLEVDPVEQARRKPGRPTWALGRYVSDRPYASSSALAVALARIFATAMRGRCDARPGLADAALDLAVQVPAATATGGRDVDGDDLDGAALARRLLGPLGWAVEVVAVPLDPEVPRWGASAVLDLRLTGRMPLARALSHLYVLLPVLEGAKHYWVSGDEVDKLLRAAGDWLPGHPERELVTRRYLAHQRAYVDDATARLSALEGVAAPEEGDGAEGGEERARPLASLRREAVVAELRRLGASRVVDVGCGEGALVADLLREPWVDEVVGVDVSATELDRAARRLDLARMPDRQRARVRLLQSSVTYRDRRLAGFDALVLSEVLEHVDLERLPALERTVLAAARPRAVVLTTPNVERNAGYGLAPGERRHADHRFEWTRAELASWAERVGAEHGYAVTHRGIGDDDEQHGQPSQLLVLERGGAA